MWAVEPGSTSPGLQEKKLSVCPRTPTGKLESTSPGDRWRPESPTGEQQPPGMPWRSSEAPPNGSGAVAGGRPKGPQAPLGSAAAREAWRILDPHARGMNNTSWWDQDNPATGQLGPEGKEPVPKGGCHKRAD